MYEKRQCPVCKRWFEPTRLLQIYDSAACKWHGMADERARRGVALKLSSAPIMTKDKR